MKKLLLLPFALAAAAAATPFLLTPTPTASAQIHGSATPSNATLPPNTDPNFACLRGMPYYYMEVTSSPNAPEEAELRNDLRDLFELELRRAGIVVRIPSPSETAQNTNPFLRLNLKWERNSATGSDCTLELSVHDKVSVLRNREQITAVIFEMRRPVNVRSEQSGVREIKNRARDLIREFVNGAKKYS